jgi:hypothetical protein
MVQIGRQVSPGEMQFVPTRFSRRTARDRAARLLLNSLEFPQLAKV